MTQYEIHEDDDSRRFENPIKIDWTGYCRSRITEYNGEFSEEECGEDSAMSPERFTLAMNRLKTRVVCVTVEEAEAVRHELSGYDYNHRTWMNAAMGRSLDRVCARLDDEMADRGYAPVWTRRTFTAYLPEDEAAERQEEINERLKRIDERKKARKDAAGEIYSHVREFVADPENSPKNYWVHGDECKIVFKRNADRSGAHIAAPLLREAGCENVRIEEEEHTDNRFNNRDPEEYTIVQVIGDIPESGFGLDR